MITIIDKIEAAKLVGRGGAGFSVASKWRMVATATGEKKYVVCNCSEGEPGVKKDGYIIEHYAQQIINGMYLAIQFLGAEKGIFYLNEAYYKQYKNILEQAITASGAKIELFVKNHEAGYVGGEETTVLNVIEGNRAEPRLRPPYPPTSGLWGCPTLVNNVETFYNVSLVNSGEYKNERFYTVIGDTLHEGVYQLPANLTVEQVLKQTENWPKYEFFVQVGGDGAGEVWSQKQLKQLATGSGSIHVYSLSKYKPIDLMLGWANFFKAESCGQCVPCREGTYRLVEALHEDKPNWPLIADVLFSLSESSFCGLGVAASIPIRTYVANVLASYPEKSTNLPIGSKKVICSNITN